MNNKILRIVKSKKPIIVWGVGTHTLRLLKTSELSKANIKYFVDSNPKYSNKKLNGKKIILPAELENKNEAILISSMIFQDNICKQK